MDEAEFKRRTRSLAIAIVQAVEALPRTRSADVIGRQLLRSGTSIGANYRAACRARSAAEMIAKLGIVEEEADETLYWLEILDELHMVEANDAQSLHRETNEILSMVVASKRTLKRRSESVAIGNLKSKVGNPS